MDKMLKIKDLRAKSSEDLHALLLELLQERFRMRMKRSVSAEIKPHKFGQIKKLIAQIKTLLNEQRGVKNESK